MATSTRPRYLALVFALSLAFAFLPGINATPAAAQDPNPIITVGPQYDAVWGDHWDPLVGITVTIGSDTWHTAADDNGNWYVVLAPHALQAGQLVVATDGTTTKDHTVFDFDLTGVDDVGNTVSGTADTGANVWVDIHDQPDTGRTVTADGSGAWTADFDIAGDGGATADLQPGTSGYASRFDGDDDVTHLDWRVPDPHIDVAVDPGSIWASDFTPNGNVTVTIDSLEIDTWPTDEWGNFDGNNYGLIFDLSVGSVVAVTDGTTTETHTVSNLAISSVDEDNNTVHGRADDGDIIDVWVHEPDVPTLTVTADASGNWSADFSAYVTFGPGTNGNSGESDAEGNRTYAFWRIPNPTFTVDPHSDGAWGGDFAATTSVTLTRGADSCTTTTDDWGNFWFDLPNCESGGSLDLHAGDTVDVSDGTTTKSHVITDLTVTGVDEVGDEVTGTASSGDVHVWVHDDGTNGTVTYDGTVWTATFAGLFDFVPGTGGAAQQYDADGDATNAEWGVPNPRFKAEVDNNGFSGWDWAPNSTVTITIDGDPLRTFDFATDEWGNFSGSVNTDVAINQFVEATDGTSTKDMFVHNLVVTAVDAELDRVIGTADPGDLVQVGIHDENGPGLDVTADATTGDWTADFAGMWDIEHGTSGSARYYEPDGDETERSWRLADPWIGASVIHEEVWANDFPDEPAGQTLYYRLDDPATPEIDFEYDMPLIVNDWGTEAGDRSFGRYDVQAGQIFTVRNRPFTDLLGDGVEKVLELSRIEVTGVDGDTDIITGYADPAEGPDICVWSQDAQLCNGDAGLSWDGAGNWTADFGFVGSDVLPGHWNSASQFDFDGDETHYWWNLPPWVVVELAEEDAAGVPLWPDAVRAEEWTGPVVTLTINGTDIDSWTVTGDGHYTFELPSIDIEVGDVVTLSDSVDTKTVVVETLTIDHINFSGDFPPNSVLGTAEPNRDVRVDASASVGGWWAERWVNADSSGDFFADFGTPGNGWREQWTADFGGAEGLGRHMRVEIYDSDNDRVETRTCEGVPRIEVMRSDGRVDAYDFPEGATVTLEITGAPEPFTAVSEQNPENPCETIATFDLGEFEIPEDATVTVFDDAGTPPVTHVVLTLTIDNVDADADTVAGTADAEAWILVEADGNWRYVYADEFGDWIADFAVSGDEPGEEQVVDLGPGSSGRAIALDDQGNTTELSWYISNAHFQVDPTSDNLWVNEFTPNTAVSITVTRNGTPVTVPAGDYITDESGHLGWGWDPIDLNLEPGDVVDVSDGTNTKDHTITNLSADPIDPDTATVSGTADPDSEVCLDVWGWGQDCTTATGGAWSFTSDPNGWYFEIGPGSGGAASQYDDDGDATQVHWGVAPLPWVTADAGTDQVWGSGDWSLDSPITITIDDPATLLDPDITTTAWMEPTEWDPNHYEFNISVGELIDLHPGFVIVATDGDYTKSLTLTTLEITDVDLTFDTVSGLADDGLDVHIDGGNDEEFDWAWRVVAPSGGSFSTNFGTPGQGDNEQSTVDLGPGSRGTAQQYDEDGDYTHAFWHVPYPPTISVVTGQLDQGPESQSVEGYGWAGHTWLTVTIDDPGNGEGDDYTAAVLTDADGNAWLNPYNDVGFVIESGFTVAMSDGTTTVTHTVTSVMVTSVDAEADKIYGTADPGSEVTVGIWGPYPYRVVNADPEGAWVADFTVPWEDQDVVDIRPPDCEAGPEEPPCSPSAGEAWQADDDGYQTRYFWSVEEPRFPTFSVRLESNEVHGYDWPRDTNVTLTIDDPGTTESPDYTDAGLPEPAEWDPNQTFVWFGEFEFEVGPGFTVEMTDGTTTKTHTVTDFKVTAIDLEADTVFGSAEFADAEVHVSVYDGPERWMRSDPTDGSWIADFSVPGDDEWEQDTFDIEPGTAGDAQELDEDGDETHIEWRVPGYPEFGVTATHDWVEGYDFEGDTITVTFDDNDDPLDGTLYTETFEIDPGEPNWLHVIDGFDIEAGQFVTVTDGTTTKTTWVSPIEITTVDTVGWAVSGVANPGEIDTFGVHPEVNGFGEHIVAVDEFGGWSLDLDDVIDPGDRPPEIPQGMLLGGGQRDEDRDRTVMFWDPAVVEGHVYADGEPVAGAEVFFSNQVGPQHTCTNTAGYYRFDSSVVLSLVHEGLAATGRAVSSEAGCSNPDFLDEAGQPLVTAVIPGPFDLWDGYEYIEFNVERATAYQTVVVEGFDGIGWIPADGVPVRVFDVSELGDPANWDYGEIWEGDVGELAFDFTGAYGEGGTVEMRYPDVPEAGVLILVADTDGILGDLTLAGEFGDRGDGVFVGPTIVFPNQAPVIVEVSGPLDPMESGMETTISVTFTDRNVHDTHDVVFEWGNGTSSEVSASDGSASADVTYGEPGVYEVTVTVTDAGGLSATDKFEYVVIYDTDGGFTTGGGWIHPEEGSVYPGVDHDDKVNFGFNVKYKKGDPGGEFNAQLGDLHLHSDAMDWLVITIEDWAHFMGVATLDGSDELYPFRVDVRDGDVSGTADDRLELTVWAPGAVPFADEPLYAVTGELGGGQIKIHRK